MAQEKKGSSTHPRINEEDTKIKMLKGGKEWGRDTSGSCCGGAPAVRTHASFW